MEEDDRPPKRLSLRTSSRDMILEGQRLQPNCENGSSSNPPQRRHRRQVCLFGLSADPPTGAGGHLSIVQALRALRKQPPPPEPPSSSSVPGPEPAGTDCDEVAPAKESSSTSRVAPESPSEIPTTDGEMSSTGDRSSVPYMFDEVWVLPVYRHTFQVRCTPHPRAPQLGPSPGGSSLRSSDNSLSGSHDVSLVGFATLFPPRKTNQEKQGRLAGFQHRLRMCELAFLDPSSSSSSSSSSTTAAEQAARRQGGGRPRVVVSDAEKRSWEAAVERAKEQCRRSQSPFAGANLAVGTASLLDYLQGEHPDVDFHFCLGADSFWDLVRGEWKESDRVLRSFRGKLWVVHRAGLTDDDEDEDGPGTTVPHRPSVESAGVGARVLLVSDATSVSSTRVRGCRDMEELSRLLPDPVLRYIKANSLYAFAATGVL